MPSWSTIYINRDESGYGLERDKKAASIFKRIGVKAYGFHDHYLHSAKEINTAANTPYKVFTPYFNKWKERAKPTVVEVVFDATKICHSPVFPEDAQAFDRLLDTQRTMRHIEFGTQRAHERLESFIQQHIQDYKETRDYPMLDATSHLSTHLRAGEISIRTVFERVNQLNNSIGKDTFLKELAWRDFYNMIYATHPDQKDVSINPAFRQIEWDNDKELFNAWKLGKTGFPLVDAAMRQLNETGWMHNRLRMLTASFLTKDLLIDWRWGERYFQQMLIDYDSANNIGGWQWAASTGVDSVPYFRIFNPTLQSEKHDPDGRFIREYVPELATISTKKIHDPSILSEAEQKQFGVRIGIDYPVPIVSHKKSRERAIRVFEENQKKYEKLSSS